MKIDETTLRRIIRKNLFRINEEIDDKPGKEQADVKGSLDVKKIATTLGVDPGNFAAAIKAAKAGNRTPAHNALLGDVFVKLMEANPNDTVTVMNVLKKVTSTEKKKT